MYIKIINYSSILYLAILNNTMQTIQQAMKQIYTHIKKQFILGRDTFYCDRNIYNVSKQVLYLNNNNQKIGKGYGTFEIHRNNRFCLSLLIVVICY